MYIAAGSRIDFVVESKVRYSEMSTHCTLSAEKKACCVIKLVGPYFPFTSIYMYLL